MQSAAFYRAAMPAKCCALGLPLRDFSNAHQVRLALKSNPLLTGVEATEKDVIQAVLICHHSEAETRRMDGDFFISLKTWLWGKHIRKADFKATADYLRAYILAGSTEPEVEEQPSEGKVERPPGTPFALRLIQFLILKMGKTEAEAWDYPHGLTKWHFAAYWESERGIRVKNQFEYTFDEYCRKGDEAEAAALKEVKK